MAFDISIIGKILAVFLHLIFAIPFPIPRTLSFTSAVLALVVALALIFAGRYIIRGLAFIAIGFVFAAAGATFGTVILGFVGTVLGAFIGFVLGGLLSFVLLPLAIGIATGLLAFNLAQALFHVYLLSLILGIVFFCVGVVISTKLLALATAFFGSLLLFEAMIYFNVSPFIAAATAVVMGAIGFWVQGGFKSRQAAKFVSWSRNPPPPTAVRIQSPPSAANSDSSRYCPRCGTRIESNSGAAFCPNCGASLSV